MEERLQRELLLQEGNHFVNRNGMRVTQVDIGSSEAELDITEACWNPFGTVHGGTLFTLADLCSGVAARADGRKYVTEQASISYIRPVATGTIRAKGTVLHRGRSRCVIDVRIYDNRDKLACAGTFSFFCKS